MNQLGYGVLAVNYPGSTGRGSEYEHRFEDERWLVDCVDAVWTYLRDNEIRVVVSWSVSTGNRMQAVLLHRELPVSALVDQSGWGRSTLLEETGRRGIPFFTIRGRHDPKSPIARVDYWYPGGHDVTSADEFAGLFAAAEPFLRSARAIEYPAEPAAALVVDLPSHGGESPPVDAEEAALGFELATQIARECFAPGAIAFTQNATVALSSFSGARADERVRREGSIPLVRVRLRPDDRARPAHDTSARATIVERSDAPILRPLDIAARDERLRLRDEQVSRDGTIVHPRLQAVARALCAQLHGLAPGAESGGPPR